MLVTNQMHSRGTERAAVQPIMQSYAAKNEILIVKSCFRKMQRWTEENIL